MNRKKYLKTLICTSAILVGTSTTVTAQNEMVQGTVVNAQKASAQMKADEQVVKYGYPESTYFLSYDTGDIMTAPAKGPIVVVTPPWMKIPFNDISNATGTPEWFVNTTPAGTNGLPSGADTPVEPDEEGNYIYPIEEARDAYYRYPILKYGDKTYKLSDKTWDAGVDVYATSGIKATSSRVAMSLMNPHFGQFYKDFQGGDKYGGRNQGVVYPLGMCNMVSDQQSNIEFICDNNFNTAFQKLGPNNVGDRWLVDCGDTIPRGEIKIHFSDAEHILKGKGVISIGNDQFNLTPVGYYDSNELEGTVFTCNAEGAKARVIDFAVTELYDKNNSAYVTEITEENIHVFSVTSRETINYPALVTDMGVYLDNVLENLSDDNPNTIYWNGGAQLENNYVMVDCGESAPRNNIKMVFCDGDKPDKAVLEISTDNKNWTELHAFTANDLTADNKYTIVVDAQGQEARYIKMKLKATSGYWLKMADFIVEGARQFSEEKEVEPIIDKMLTYYPKPADPFYLDMITMFSCSYDGANKILPNGQKLKLAILKLNEDKSLGDTIATTSVTVSDIIRRPFTFSDGIVAFIIDWKFYKEPEDGIGTPEQTSILIDSPFAVMVYDIDQVVGVSLSMLFGYKETIADLYGEAKYTYRKENKEYTKGPFSYWWSLFGKFKTLRPDEACKTMTASLDGGEAGYINENGERTTNGIFYSSSDMKDKSITIETPEWITCTFGETVNGKTEFTVMTQKGTEEREGDIVITDGEISTTIKVVQKAETGIAGQEAEKVRVAEVSEGYVVSYPETYNRLSVYSSNGMLVADYMLDGNGTVTVSKDITENRGVYILKLEGNSKPYITKIVK